MNRLFKRENHDKNKLKPFSKRRLLTRDLYYNECPLLLRLELFSRNFLNQKLQPAVSKPQTMSGFALPQSP